MRLLVAALADYANIAVGDKLNLGGVFDTIWVRQFPTLHPQMFLALRLQMEYEDGGKEHTLQVMVEKASSTPTLQRGLALVTFRLVSGSSQTRF